VYKSKQQFYCIESTVKWEFAIIYDIWNYVQHYVLIIYNMYSTKIICIGHVADSISRYRPRPVLTYTMKN